MHKISKYIPDILTGIGCIGVVVTAVLAVEGDRKREGRTLKESWKCYIPAAISGTASIASIVSSNRVNAKRLAAMASACAMAGEALKDYKETVRDICGEEKAKEIEAEVLKRTKQKEFFGLREKVKCKDFMGREFYASPEEIRVAELNLNQLFSYEGQACVNDFYKFLDLDYTKAGEDYGWVYDPCNERTFISFQDWDDHGVYRIETTWWSQPDKNYLDELEDIYV